VLANGVACVLNIAGYCRGVSSAEEGGGDSSTGDGDDGMRWR